MSTSLDFVTSGQSRKHRSGIRLLLVQSCFDGNFCRLRQAIKRSHGVMLCLQTWRLTWRHVQTRRSFFLFIYLWNTNVSGLRHSSGTVRFHVNLARRVLRHVACEHATSAADTHKRKDKGVDKRQRVTRLWQSQVADVIYSACQVRWYGCQQPMTNCFLLCSAIRDCAAHKNRLVLFICDRLFICV